MFLLLVFFIIKTSSKNYIMRGTHARNPVNKPKKAQMSFSKPFSPHQIFFYAMIDIHAIFLHEHNDFIEDNGEFKLGGEDLKKFNNFSKILKF